jgi:hypothetical protein
MLGELRPSPVPVGAVPISDPSGAHARISAECTTVPNAASPVIDPGERLVGTSGAGGSGGRRRPEAVRAAAARQRLVMLSARRPKRAGTDG